MVTFYTGELISEDEAVRRESQYTEADGSYMLFFKRGRRMLWLVTYIYIKMFMFVFFLIIVVVIVVVHLHCLKYTF